MSILAAPILHDIKDPTDWPEQFSEISDQFFRPLPKYVASKARRREFLSLGCLESYEEALGSSLLAVRDEDTPERSTITATDVIDSILSCVMMVKVASSVCASRGHMQARLSWISLLTQLGIAISEDTIILEDATFLRARTTTKSVITDIEDLIGRSSLLLATLLNSPPDMKNASDAANNIDEKEPEIHSCNYSTASEASLDGLDIPLDAHILPGCGKRLNCLLPVVCVAPEHEIEALLTTVVCQRYVLNITLPVVGVSLPTSGTTAKIILGWAEGKEDDTDAAVPVIHMACAQGNTIHPSVGVFDLLDPASSLYFSQFILWLQPYFSTIRECDDLQTRKFCWRLDHVGYDHSIQSSSNPSRIQSWIRVGISDSCASGIKAQSPSDTMPPKKGGSTTHSKASSSSQFLQVPPPLSRRGRSRSRSRQSAHLPPPHSNSSSSSSSSNASEDGDSRSRSPSPASAGLTASYYPASSFAKLSPGTGAQEKWLSERRTIRLFRIEPFQPDSDLGRQVCRMVQEYNKIIQYSWPASWDTISQVPSRDSVHENIRQRLFDSYQEFKTDPKFSPMEEDIFRSINNHVSALYRAVANAKASQQQAKVKEAKEAALRSSWDELLKAVCCDFDDASSSSVIVETSIPLPRNKATELGSAFGADAQALVPENILSKQLYASARNSTTRVPDAIRIAVTVSYLHAQSTKPSTIVKSQDRSYEPATAIVDATCYLQYDIRKEKGRDSKLGQEIQEDPKPKKKREKSTGWIIKRVSGSSSMNKVCIGREPDELLPAIDKRSVASRHATCFMCPFVADNLDLPSANSGFVPHREVHIPYLFTVYKRDSSGGHQAFHQAQMYLTFGVEFLAALGIKDQPVWALVTSGTTGTIIMAWKATAAAAANPTSTAVEYNFIIDQYVRSFDISQPLEALQMMVCLRRIYQRGLALQAALAQRIDPSVFTNATAMFQDRMMPPRSESKTKA